jgi:hypothetical protein
MSRHSPARKSKDAERDMLASGRSPWAEPKKPIPVIKEPERVEPKYRIRDRLKAARWVNDMGRV